jgi:superoxide oxidase
MLSSEDKRMNTLQGYRYPIAVRWIHWLGVLTIAAAYLTSETAEGYGGRLASGINWHVVTGIGLLLLFVPRVLARLLIRNRPTSFGAEKWMAWTVQIALLLFMVVQPVLGVLTVWAGGHSLPIPFTSLQWGPLVRLPGWEDALEEAHEVVGNAFYGVIGLHVLAALWHQFVRRDGLLRRMV